MNVRFRTWWAYYDREAAHWCRLVGPAIYHRIRAGYRVERIVTREEL